MECGSKPLFSSVFRDDLSTRDEPAPMLTADSKEYLTARKRM